MVERTLIEEYTLPNGVVLKITKLKAKDYLSLPKVQEGEQEAETLYKIMATLIARSCCISTSEALELDDDVFVEISNKLGINQKKKSEWS
ncbi:hypothetical protein [Campylobacter sp. RM12637]|uniref:hypothetical protein n=1 Tax=Campylobacter sp. RM12637 TaxID=2735734 RepID=UPI00301507B7|nr:hypothetical protein [Campylobacter sp. RM12637]